jgi:hypothetical protein
VVGPSFGIVSGWAEQGVPLKIAFAGIDRYFERYYRKGPRRRPVKIDFCDADVLDVFDEWRRATGIQSSGDSPAPSSQLPAPSHQSLPAHLERVVLRLTSARARGSLGDAFDALIDRAAAELDTARAKAGGLRGRRARHCSTASPRSTRSWCSRRATLDEAALGLLSREAESELSGFRHAMTEDAFARAPGVIDRGARAVRAAPSSPSCEPMLKPGDVIPLTIEKPAAGGR